MIFCCCNQTGTLDSLVILNDQLAKFDPQLEGIVNRFVTNLKGLLEDDSDKVKENLIVNDRNHAFTFTLVVDIYFQAHQKLFFEPFHGIK